MVTQRSTISVQEIFEAWKLLTLQRSAAKYKARAKQLQQDIEALEYTMEIESQKLERTKRALAQSNVCIFAP